VGLVASASALAHGQTQAEQPLPTRDELRYDGKSFQQWQTDLRTELGPAQRVKGLKAPNAAIANGYGAEATQAILAVIAHYDLTLFEKFKVTGNFAGEDTERLYKEEVEIIQTAALAMCKIGVAAVPELRKALKDKNRNVRRFALAVFAESAKTAIPELVEALLDQDNDVRLLALGLLDKAGTDLTPQTLRPHLAQFMKALDERDGNVCRVAIKILGTMKAAARPAKEKLIAILKDGNRGFEVRTESLAAVQELAGSPKDLAPVLRDILERERQRPRAERNQDFEQAVMGALKRNGAE